MRISFWRGVCLAGVWMNEKSKGAVGGEKPLGKAAAAGLACMAGGTILLFYVFAGVSVVFLLVLLTCELGLAVAAARFGLVGTVARVMTRHAATLPIFLRSLRMGKAAEFQISLEPGDAPALFALLKRLCERMQAALPRKVSLEMTANPWVRPHGY